MLLSTYRTVDPIGKHDKVRLSNDDTISVTSDIGPFDYMCQRFLYTVLQYSTIETSRFAASALQILSVMAL